MIEETLSGLRRVFDYLLGILIILAILEPMVKGYFGYLGLLSMAAFTTAVGVVGHSKELWNQFKPGGN